MNKAVLILVDGMRPDGMTACGHPEVQKLMAEGKSTLRGHTVMPYVTLPCHMSLMHSVDPERHGVLTNTFTPQVRPVTGLFAQLAKYDKKERLLLRLVRTEGPLSAGNVGRRGFHLRPQPSVGRKLRPAHRAGGGISPLG